MIGGKIEIYPALYILDKLVSLVFFRATKGVVREDKGCSLTSSTVSGDPAY